MERLSGSRWRWRVRLEVQLALELVSSCKPSSHHFLNTQGFQTLDTDLGWSERPLTCLRWDSPLVGSGKALRGSGFLLPPPGMGLEPAASESALRRPGHLVLHGHSKDLWFLRVGAGRPRPLEACTGASSLGSRGGRGGKSGPLPRRSLSLLPLTEGGGGSSQAHGAGRWDLGASALADRPLCPPLHRQWLQLTMFAWGGARAPCYAPLPSSIISHAFLRHPTPGHTSCKCLPWSRSGLDLPVASPFSRCGSFAMGRAMGPSPASNSARGLLQPLRSPDQGRQLYASSCLRMGLPRGWGPLASPS